MVTQVLTSPLVPLFLLLFSHVCLFVALLCFPGGKKGEEIENKSPHYILKVYISHICDSGKTAFKA